MLVQTGKDFFLRAGTNREGFFPSRSVLTSNAMKHREWILLENTTSKCPFAELDRHNVAESAGFNFPSAPVTKRRSDGPFRWASLDPFFRSHLKTSVPCDHAQFTVFSKPGFLLKLYSIGNIAKSRHYGQAPDSAPTDTPIPFIHANS